MSEWRDLTERLRRMGVQLGINLNNQEVKKRHRPIESVVNGRELQTIYGPVFSVGNYYPVENLHGQVSLSPIATLSRINRWAKSKKTVAAAMENIIFLDTETTGLSGGTGTMAFMIGAARYRDSGVVLEQFFLRNPAEESAQLAALESFCAGMEAIVTYNGKSFDVPILTTRFILNGMLSPFEGLDHFDLLGLTRRLWRPRLGACNLGNIEKEILKLHRTEAEVPGYLVPEYYADYLRSGDASMLAGVFYHNEVDVISLVALFKYLAEVLEDPTAWNNPFYKDLTALGTLLEIIGEQDLAKAIYARSLDSEDKQDRLAALLRTGILHKARRENDEAAGYWQEAAGHGSVFAMIELAKYHEHKLRDPAEALRWTDEALALANGDPTLYAQLQHRRKRLLAKLARLKPPQGDTAALE